MKLSVILIAYDMAREIPRSLQALSRSYQHGAQALDYEVILIDNGSPVALDPASWAGIDVPVRLIHVENASPSPANAINLGLKEAEGEIICLMIDGAHILTPGVFRMALACYAVYANPVVATRYFWLGPDAQNVSIAQGYNRSVEDQLLQSINWPEDGYRLYEIGTPLRQAAENINWFNRMFESNCLFMKRALFERLGGADERFDFPGGGFINMDIFNRAIEAPEVTAAQLIGEGCFHQLHGGTTTNVSTEKLTQELDKYRQQFAAIRGHDDFVTKKKFYFMGHLPTEASKIHRIR
jgi:glycosyltransferase involved in cell wall biosynthesis